MTWRYVVTKRTYNADSDDPEVIWGIHELYEHEGKIGWTEDGVTPQGESLEWLRETLTRMLEALDMPMVDYDNEVMFEIEASEESD